MAINTKDEMNFQLDYITNLILIEGLQSNVSVWSCICWKEEIWSLTFLSTFCFHVPQGKSLMSFFHCRMEQAECQQRILLQAGMIRSAGGSSSAASRNGWKSHENEGSETSPNGPAPLIGCTGTTTSHHRPEYIRLTLPLCFSAGLLVYRPLWMSGTASVYYLS